MITLNQVDLRRGPTLLLDKADLVVRARQKLAVIGANGCGKTSLFKLLLNELHADNGEVSLPTQWRIAHMAQEVASVDRPATDYVLDGDKQLRQIERQIRQAEQRGDDQRLGHLYEKMDSMHGYEARYRAEKLLHGLGFRLAQITLPVNSFSGGWRIRLNLAQALMCPSDLLLLDEPTNHLDLDATYWLEQWLKSYPGTLLLISHDRDFIDNVADGVVHFEQKKLHRYKGNYSAFEIMRAERLAQQQASYEKQQQRRKEIEEFVRRFRYKATKARQAQSRLKELHRMESIAPAHVDSPFHFCFRPGRTSYSALVNLGQADIGYGDKTVLQEVNLDLQPGSRIGLLGPNGAGKSTLIKALTGALKISGGARTCGEHLQTGYFAQHQLEALDLDASPVLHLQRLSPTATEQDVRNFLGGFNFQGDKAVSTIKSFSGGEKARLALAIVVWQRPNLLLLDEPTNHLDLEMRHALTEALQSYEGALVVVSHDRYLLRNTVDLFYLVANGTVEEFDGDLQDYQNWLKEFSQNEDEQDSGSGKTVKTAGVDKKRLRQQSAEKRRQLAPLSNRIRQLEQQMDELSNELQRSIDSLADPSIYDENNAMLLRRTLTDKAKLEKKLNLVEEQWMESQEQLEQLATSRD